MKFEGNETIELKKSTSELKDAVISICAMLNQHGKGTVYFGIADDAAGKSGSQRSRIFQRKTYLNSTNLVHCVIKF